MLRSLLVLSLASSVAAFAPSSLSFRSSSALPSTSSIRPAVRTGVLNTQAKLAAIIFACDGVLVDSERDGHRVALNEAMKESGIKKDGKQLECSVEEYGKLLKARGEKSLMTVWKEMGWDGMDMDSAVKIYDRKNEIFQKMVKDGVLPIRPGVTQLIDEAIEAGIPLAVASSNTQKNVESIVAELGQVRASKMQIFAGGRVVNRKPSPDIYNLCKGTMGFDGSNAVVIEDDRDGLAAAKAAGMACVITTSTYTAGEDFKEADAVFGDLKSGSLDLEAISKMPLSMAGLNA